MNMNNIHLQLDELFSAPAPRAGDLVARVDGKAAANKAVAECDPDSSMIFLTKSEYEDLIYQAVVAELKTYKKKVIIVVSDAVRDLVA
jgi:hypothetical protein